jgi:hypothetical protein
MPTTIMSITARTRIRTRRRDTITRTRMATTTPARFAPICPRLPSCKATCTGAILVLVFAIGQGLMWAGVLSTFAMALGTAITVSVLAASAVGFRELAARLAGGSGASKWADRVQLAAGLTGASLVLVLGAAFFWASLGAAKPF